jgi:hypothetical protein
MVPQIRLADALRNGDDPLHVVPYFVSLGLPLQSLDDLLRINDDPDEEELHSFRVAEGIAVTMASDNLWVLFLP